MVGLTLSVTPGRRRLAFEAFEEHWEAIEAGGARLGQLYLQLSRSRRRVVPEEVKRRMALSNPAVPSCLGPKPSWDGV